MFSFRSTVALFAALAAYAYGRPQIGGAYNFPDAVDEILSAPIVEDFTCDGRDYG